MTLLQARAIVSELLERTCTRATDARDRARAHNCATTESDDPQIRQWHVEASTDLLRAAHVDEVIAEALALVLEATAAGERSRV